MMAAVVFLTLAAVLRTREYHADARASEWDESRQHLARVLRDGPGRGWWWMAGSFHPTARERRRALEEPERLLRIGFAEAFSTGVIALVAADSVLYLVSALANGLEVSIPQFMVLGLVFAPLVAGVAASGIWRLVFANRAARIERLQIVRLALALTLGIVAGRMIAFQSIVSQLEEPTNPSAFWLGRLALALLLFLTLTAFLSWMAAGAAAWRRVTPPGRFPRRAYLAGMVVSGGVLTVWGGLLLQNAALTTDIGSLAEMVTFSIGVWKLAPMTAVLFVLLGLWAFPLSASLSAGYENDSPHDRSHARALIVASAIGAVAYCALYLAMRIGAHQSLPESVRSGDDFLGAAYSWAVSRAIVTQLLVALFVAGWAGRRGALYGLAGATLTALFISVGSSVVDQLARCIDVLSLSSRLQCTDPISLMGSWRFFARTGAIGGTLALGASVIFAWVGAMHSAAVRRGLSVGVAFSALWVCITFQGRIGPGTEENGDVYGLFIGFLLLFQTLSVAIAAVKSRRRPFRDGMAAALASGSIAVGTFAASSFSMSVLFVTGAELSALFGILAIWGIAAALPVALVASALTWAARRFHGPAGELETMAARPADIR